MKWLDHLEEWVISTLMASATVIVFVAVIHRYLSGVAVPGLQDWLLGLHFGWVQEATIYLFVWMAKFGAAYGVRTGIHVGVDVVIMRMSSKNRKMFVLFGLLAGGVFTAVIASLGAYFVWENGAHYVVYQRLGLSLDGLTEGPTTPDLEWPTWIIYLAIPLGSALMSFRFLQVAWAFARTGVLPHHDHGHVMGLDGQLPHPKGRSLESKGREPG